MDEFNIVEEDRGESPYAMAGSHIKNQVSKESIDYIDEESKDILGGSQSLLSAPKFGAQNYASVEELNDPEGNFR